MRLPTSQMKGLILSFPLLAFGIPLSILSYSVNLLHSFFDSEGRDLAFERMIRYTNILYRFEKDGSMMVRKKYMHGASLILPFSSTLGPFPKELRWLAATDRLLNEVRMLERLHECSIMAPKIIGYSLEARTLDREFLKGETLSRIIRDNKVGQSLRKTGRLLYDIHEKTHSTLTDPNPNNVIILERGQPAFIDFELSIPSTSRGKALDIAIFLSSLEIICQHGNIPTEISKKFFQEFLEGYGMDMNNALCRALDMTRSYAIIGWLDCVVQDLQHKTDKCVYKPA